MKKSTALKTLGLSDDATDDEIRKAHRKLIIENHPDKFGQNETARANAEEKTKLINEARDVLLNHSWDPEYASAGTPYGAPFSYDPFVATYGQQARRSSSSSESGSSRNTTSYNGWPFDETFVWTTWDSSGRQHTYTSSTTRKTSSSPYEQNPFVGFNPYVNPFSSSYHSRGTADPFSALFNIFFTQEKTWEEKYQEAKSKLALDIKLVLVKLAILALSFLLSVPATGLYLYTIISIGQGIWKRLHYLSLVFLVPFAMLAIIFAPSGGMDIVGLIPFILFACSVVFDAQNIYRHAKQIRELKAQKSAPPA